MAPHMAPPYFHLFPRKPWGFPRLARYMDILLRGDGTAPATQLTQPSQGDLQFSPPRVNEENKEDTEAGRLGVGVQPPGFSWRIWIAFFVMAK
jgi:hypothetical protein